MKTATIKIAIGFLLLFPILSKAQQKQEREFRIKAEAIPQSAKDFIDSLGIDSNIKWYKEISIKEVTLEAKFKHNKKNFSVEFDTLGKLQDVEFEIKKTEITPNIYNNIVSKLDSMYQKWMLQKIQIQYSGNMSYVIAAIRKNEATNLINVLYEIVLIGKNLEDTHLYEISFNKQGEILNILQIIQEKADHLEN